VQIPTENNRGKESIFRDSSRTNNIAIKKGYITENLQRNIQIQFPVPKNVGRSWKW